MRTDISRRTRMHLRGLFEYWRKRPTRAQSAPRPQEQPIEALEQRRLLSGSSISGGVLTVSGDANANTLSIQVSSGTLTVTDNNVPANTATVSMPK